MSYFRSRKETNPLPDALADGSSARDPEARAERRFALADVKEAISDLNDIQRQVLSLYLIKDEDYETVAAQVGRSIPAVRVIKHRGLRKVRARIAEAA
jgi:RNA polymerase sigma factor (sigma-70 family)